ncbi:DUF6115 domain-containing protein [Paenibacillus sp. CAU 1782]
MDAWQYIVLLGAVVVVFAIILPKRATGSGSPGQSAQNMETALEQFMENMERDNEDLVELVKNAQQSNRKAHAAFEERIADLELRCQELDGQLQAAAIFIKEAAASRQMASVAPSAPPAGTMAVEQVQVAAEHSVPTRSIESRYGELFTLYREGKSIEAIAKKLGMNKGEVSLIIGLAKQEGGVHG